MILLPLIPTHTPGAVRTPNPPIYRDDTSPKSDSPTLSSDSSPSSSPTLSPAASPDLKSSSPTLKSTKRMKQKVPKIQVIPPPPPELDFMLPPVCLETELPRFPQRAYAPPGPPMHYRRVERGRSHGLLGRYDEQIRVDPWW